MSDETNKIALLADVLLEYEAERLDGEELVSHFGVKHLDAVPGQRQDVGAWLSFSLWTGDLHGLVPSAALARRMRLLELLVRVSIAAKDDWSMALPIFMNDSSAEAILQPKFLIQVDIPKINPDRFVDVLEALLQGVADRNGMQTVDDPVLRDLFERYEQRVTKPIHSVVELGLIINNGKLPSTTLFKLVEVLERFGEAQYQRREAALARGDLLSVEFRVVVLQLRPMCVVANSALRILGALLTQSRHLHVKSVSFGRLRDCDAVCAQQCLNDLITPTGGRVKQLKLHGQQHSVGAVEAAARYSHSVEHVEWELCDQPTVASAAWLAFGLFHPDSQSQVSSLRIKATNSEVFTSEWLATFTRALTTVVSPEDLAPLDSKLANKVSAAKSSGSPFDEIPLPSDKRVFVTVREGTKARAQPQARAPIVAVLDEENKDDEELEREPMRFQVIRRLHGWIALAVPGAGAGWVASNAIIHENETPTQIHDPSRPITNCRVQSFVFTLEDGTGPSESLLDAIHGLLEIIGESLAALHLPLLGLSLPEDVEQILNTCPNLIELNLRDNSISDFTSLLEAYKSGKCKINTLNIAQEIEHPEVVINQAVEIMVQGVVKAIEVAVSPLDRELEEFDRSVLTAQLRQAMIDSPSVEYLGINGGEEDEDHFSHFLEEVIPSLAQVHVPLALPSKLAFLSVLENNSKEKKISSHVDASIVGSIFQFASTSKSRKIWISIC